MKRLCLALALSAPLAAVAHAADFTQVMLDMDGKPLCSVEVKAGAECPADKVFTLARIARNALYAVYPDEQNLSGDEKFKRAEIAQAVVGSADVKLKAEDVALIKRLVAKLFGPLVVHQAWLALDPGAGK